MVFSFGVVFVVLLDFEVDCGKGGSEMVLLELFDIVCDLEERGVEDRL